MSKCQTEGGHKESCPEEQSREKGLERLLGYFVWFLDISGNGNLDVVKRVGALLSGHSTDLVLLLVGCLDEGSVLDVRGQGRGGGSIAVRPVVAVSASQSGVVEKLEQGKGLDKVIPGAVPSRSLLGDDSRYHGVYRLLTPAPPTHALLLLLLEVLQPVVTVSLPVSGAGERGGAGYLTHRAQRVGLLGGGGLVSPGDGSVDHSVGSRHHLELFCLTHKY